MEDSSHYTLTIMLYSKQHVLDLRDFQQQSPLIALQQVSPRFGIPSSSQLSVLNSILYYIISVVHRVPIANYERTIQRSISSFYLKNGMRIKIYEYSRVCSAALAVNVYECVHIVHYLIYGCFASASYVNLIVDMKGENLTQKKEKPKCDKKWKMQSEKQLFLKDLEDVLKVKTVQQKEVKVEEENYNKRIIHNPYQIKLPNVQGRQTSPMMNLLRNKEFQLGSTIRISKKIRHRDNSKLIHSLFSHSNKNKTSIVTSEKKAIENKKVTLNGLLGLKQKLKSDNQFLDQLRISLTSSESQFRRFRCRQPYEPNLQKIDLVLSKKLQNQHPIQQPSQPPPQILVVVPEKKPSTTAMTVKEQQNLGQKDGFNYKFMAATQKIPFQSKLNLYKKEYKQFIQSRSKQFSVN